MRDDVDRKPELAACEIHCEECRRPWTDPRERWRAYRALDELAYYCVRCADAEFDRE